MGIYEELRCKRSDRTLVTDEDRIKDFSQQWKGYILHRI